MGGQTAPILPSSLSLPFRLPSIMPFGSWRLAAASWGRKVRRGRKDQIAKRGARLGLGSVGFANVGSRPKPTHSQGADADADAEHGLSLSLRATAVGTATARATFGHILGHAIRPLAHRRKLFLARPLRCCSVGSVCDGQTLTSNETNFSCPLSEMGLMKSRGVSNSRFERNPHRPILRVRFSCAFVCLPVPWFG